MLAKWRLVIAAIFSLTVLPVLTLSAQTAGDRIVAADFKGDSIELISVLQVVNSNNSKVAIDVPSDTTGQKVRMNLQAISPATPHRWAVFTLTNPDLVGHNFVLQIPRQGFIKSGLIWPRPNATRIISVSASTGIKPVLINSRTAQNYALSIEPGRTVSFAIELSPLELQQALLWHRDAYEVQAGQQAFFNGVVLGIAFLLGVAILSLFAVRQMAVFPAASLFAWSLIGFLLLNDGFLSLVTSQAVEMVWGPTIRGVVEAMMLVGLSVTALAFLQLPKNAPMAAIIFWIATATGIGLAGFSFIDPLMASGLARIGFAIAAVLALFTALML
ncbi:MAG TPA: hypothetical protein ENJ55_02350, partial [Rhizobiales bacterium]|nr:hypothetical protein [Hyphomicrobiales bacterium]